MQRIQSAALRTFTCTAVSVLKIPPTALRTLTTVSVTLTAVSVLRIPPTAVQQLQLLQGRRTQEIVTGSTAATTAAPAQATGGHTGDCECSKFAPTVGLAVEVTAPLSVAVSMHLVVQGQHLRSWPYPSSPIPS
eukprot:g15964.t1